MKKIVKKLANIKLAVFIILLVAAVSAVGTFYESASGEAYYAQKLVFKSPYMYFALFLLIINLTAVMVDRWPWKVRHTGFVCAHIGIIVILFGSWVTQKFGVDGSMAIDIGGKSRSITLPDRQLNLYSYDDNLRPQKMGSLDTDFIVKMPGAKDSLFEVEGKPLTLKEYYHFAERDEKIVKSDNVSDGSAIRFLLSNDNVSVSEWMFIAKSKKDHVVNLGPAQVIWDYGTFKYRSGNVIHLSPKDDKIAYKIYSKKVGGLTKEGVTGPGSTIETGWMGLELRIFNYYKHSTKKITYIEKERLSKATHSAIQINFDGKDHWLGLNSIIRFYTKNKAYILSYGQKQIRLDFDIFLKKFIMDKYQGTGRASSYASDVYVNGLGEINISMNEPLKHKGFTFYQSSFTNDESGKAVASVLSVNQDPGRWWKYIGCIIMVFGMCHLFYYKTIMARRKKKANKSAV